MLGTLYGLLCAASWAIGSITMRDLSHKLDPFALNAPRSTVGALLLVAIAVSTGRLHGYSTMPTEQWALLLGSMLVGGFLGDTAYVLSIVRIGVSRAFPIAATYPALTLVLAVLLYEQSITFLLILGMLLTIVGVIAISQGRSAPSIGNQQTAKTSGIVWALAASVLWAAATTMLQPGLRDLDALAAAAVRLPMLALALWLAVAVRGSWAQFRQLTRAEWFTLILGGAVGWGLGSLLFVVSVAMIGSARAAVITSTSPLFALPMSLAFLREHSDWRVALGTGLAVAGIILVA
jgi:drug/metabolite transporter (DMT)-like permease